MVLSKQQENPMSILSATIGRFVPKYRLVSQWCDVYSEIVKSRPISKKTIENRKGYAARIRSALGSKTISSIRPHDIACVINKLAAVQPHAAARTLVEALDMFNEALVAGWIDVNPALAVRKPRIRVVRERLSLDEWQKTHDYADCCSPPWVSRMMVLALVTGQRRGDLQKMRFSDVWEDHLHVVQQKTGTRVAIPLDLRLDAIGMTVRDAVAACRSYAALEANGDAFLIRKTTTGKLAATSLSWRFEQAREGAIGLYSGKGSPPSLHECRSLAERLYREQGVKTMLLLGHANQSMTDLYNRDRGLSAREGKWKTLVLPTPLPPSA